MRFTEKYTKSAMTIIGVVFAIVLFWRGVWGLLDEFLFPGNPILSYIISAVAGIIILYFSKKIHLTV
jgi:Zn-dependent protease with chaperone function